MSEPLAFNEDTHFLGSPCKRGHRYGESGSTIRYRSNKGCVECHRADQAKWGSTTKGRESARERSRRYLESHPEARERKRTLERQGLRKKLADPDFRAARNAAARERLRLRRLRDPDYRIKSCVAAKLRQSLKVKKKRDSTEATVGYSIAELRGHLESQFDESMTWDNYGEHWEIDHKIPLCAYNFDGPDDPRIKQAWALSNLRPLARSENRRKRGWMIPMAPYWE